MAAADTIQGRTEKHQRARLTVQLALREFDNAKQL
jgi:hypothetical protein